ncbi:MAG: flavodoxin, partial [Butyricicoccus sp.]
MMKKVTALLLSALMVFGLAACGSESNNDAESQPVNESTASGSGTAQQIGEEGSGTITMGNKSLVVYYSATGNTEAVAKD